MNISIQDQVVLDLREAMIAKDETKKSLLRVLIGEFNRVDKIVPDEKATAILKKMMENASDPKSGNPAEASILESYLPKQLTKDQLEMIISHLIENKGYTGIKDMGKVMGNLKEEFGGRYDGKLASEIIKQRLS